MSRGKVKDPSLFLKAGLQLLQQGEPRQALAKLTSIMGAKEVARDAVYLASVAHYQLGERDTAAKYLQRLLSQGVVQAQVLDLLANIHQDRGEDADAERLYRKAVALNPGLASPHNNLGTVLRAQGKSEEALAAFSAALECDPNHLDARCNLANTLAAARRYEEARTVYAAALTRGEHAGARLGLGKMMAAAGDVDDALEAWAQVRNAPQQEAAAQWLSAVTMPPVLASEAARRIHLARIRRKVAGLEAVKPSPWTRAALAESTPFYVHYQDGNHRDFQAQVGRFVRAAVKASEPPRSSPPARTRPRVAVVGHHFFEHTVGKFVRGWSRHLDPLQVELQFFQLGRRRDQVTETLAARAPLTVLSERFEAAAEQLFSASADVIFYPELGMYPATVLLAALRLAPRQAVGIGHPVTSGLETIDTFLSGSFEREDADAHYTETLVRLPGTSLCFEEPIFNGSSWSLAELGVPPGAFVFATLQSLFKYLPEHDRLYAQLLDLCPDAWLLFLSSGQPALDQRFVMRMKTSFEAQGVDFEARCRLVPRLPHQDFLGLYRQAQVVLDVPGFCGGSTTLEALSAGVPVVTWPSAFARGRVTMGMCLSVGLEAAICESGEQYVASAARLYEDGRLRARLKARILAEKKILFEDLRPVRALEAWCRES